MKSVYFFGKGKADGNGKMKDLLGGKGAGLAEMTNIGIPVPPGFTITTEVCNYFYKNKGKLPPDLENEVRESIRRIEELSNKKFGGRDNPLLFSVRSGAKFSMPGMMDTVLNLGLNDETVKGLIEISKNERSACDAYRRLIQMFGNVVKEIEKDDFEKIISEKKREKDLRKMRRQCQTKTLFRMKDDKKGSYHILNSTCHKATRQYLQRQYGERVTEIFNDVLEKEPFIYENYPQSVAKATILYYSKINGIKVKEMLESLNIQRIDSTLHKLIEHITIIHNYSED